MSTAAPQLIVPHPGPQTKAHASSADILIYGGGAGSGKTRYLLAEPTRHLSNPGFNAVIFRRTYPRITNVGGLWDESFELYPHLGGVPNYGDKEWKFPSGSKIQFRHLEYEKNLQDWHGAQICYIGFDEVCEFTERQFVYMMTRARSTCGVKPYIRGTCNPDSESWLAPLVDWWIDDDGYPIYERSGLIRWMVRVDEQLKHFPKRKEAIRALMSTGISRDIAELLPKSFTFIPAKLEDNPTLMQKDPAYLGNLLAQPMVDRLRLHGGNWKVRPMVGKMFPRNRWNFIEAEPVGLRWARGWDKAGTEGGSGARSAGVAIGYEAETMRWYVGHAAAGRWNEIDRENEIKAIARRDDSKYGMTTVILEQEPGSGGKGCALRTARSLSGHDVRVTTVTGEKASRWRSFAAQVQAHNVTIVDDGTWDVEEFISELDNLSGDKELDKPRLKDLADASSLAFNFLTDTGAMALPAELICSGNPEDEPRAIIPDERLDEDLPPILADIVREQRTRQEPGESRRGRRRDWWNS